MSRRESGEIRKISDLFETYTKKLRAPQKTVIKTFQEVITDILGVEIRKEACTYTVATKTLGLSVSGPLKTEILLRKKEILTHLKGRLGEKSAPNDIV